MTMNSSPPKRLGMSWCGARREPLGHPLQELVADGVAERVAATEVVEVTNSTPWCERCRREPLGEFGGELRAVGQAGQLVVRGRPPQLLGAATLLGDVLDVGDREPLAVVLEHRDRRVRPHDRSVVTHVALLDRVVVDRAGRGAHEQQVVAHPVVGVGDVADRAPDEFVASGAHHGEHRVVDVDDAPASTVANVMPPWNASQVHRHARCAIKLAEIAQRHHHLPDRGRRHRVDRDDESGRAAQRRVTGAPSNPPRTAMRQAKQRGHGRPGDQVRSRARSVRWPTAGALRRRSRRGSPRRGRSPRPPREVVEWLQLAFLRAEPPMVRVSC
jgi:hypothetical protein